MDTNNALVARKLIPLQFFLILFLSQYKTNLILTWNNLKSFKKQETLGSFLNQTAALCRFHWLMWKKPSGVEHFLRRTKSNRHAAFLRMCLINQLLHFVSLQRQDAAVNGK